jgi:FAD/FMN-containing dehydrogenase
MGAPAARILTERSLAPGLLDRFAAIVGAKNVLTAAEDVAPHLIEQRHLFKGACGAVVRPGSTAEVAAVVRACAETSTPIVPQGGNTGLVGGQVPFDSGAIVVALTRLDRVRDVDPAGNTMIVEAGVTLQGVQEAAAKHDRLFPLSLGSEGSCRIGGNIATNAGGTAVLAYGNTRDLVLGLEVVLADGRVWDGLRRLRKDNTGFDLKNLFVGSEGALGLVTASVLKLFPRPKAQETAYVAVPDPAAALRLLAAAQERAGPAVTTFELLPRFGVDMVLRHATGVRDPLAEPHPWYVLMELSSGVAGSLRETVEAILGDAFEAGVARDAALAESLDQRKAFWRMREAMSEVQVREGGSIKHDVSVPVARVPEFLEQADAVVERMVPGARICGFGHLGDGNIHYNVSQPVGADRAAFIARWAEVNEAVHAIVTRLGGSISAEHGIGVLKRDLLPGVKSEVELDLMRRLKRTLDPQNILNPGKVLP